LIELNCGSTDLELLLSTSPPHGLLQGAERARELLSRALR
jgi:hypothetical protein